MSTAFDGRLAMHVLLRLGERPDTRQADRLGAWLVRNQHEEGGWPFPSTAYDDDLAPWFRAWPFPSLNPAACVTGLAHALGIPTLEMLARVERLWHKRASLDDARSGNFYSMLPMIEYVAHIQIPERETWLNALAEGIDRGIAANAFGDAEHALEHIVGGGPDLIVRLDRDDLVRVLDSVLEDQRDGGGWPTPYSPAWRPWVTANTLVLLAQLREM